MASATSATGSHVGFAFDGDADRVIFADEKGAVRDGDAILYLLARRMAETGALDPARIVATSMSNLGLEHALRALDIPFERARVGDRYVLEELRASGGIIGGETSGHMLVLDKATTGDGLVCALQLLAILKESGKPLSELVAGMPKYPPKMVNVRTEQRLDPGKSPAICDAVARAEDELAETGRVVLRASGCVPVIVLTGSFRSSGSTPCWAGPRPINADRGHSQRSSRRAVTPTETITAANSTTTTLPQRTNGVVPCSGTTRSVNTAV